MERIDQLERQVRNLSLAVRLGLAVIIAAFATQSCVVLSQGHSFSVLCINMFGSPNQITAMSIFFFEFATHIMAGIVIIAVLTIVSLFAFSRQVWCIPVGVLAAIIVIAVGQLAVFAFQLPMVKIVTLMAK